MKKQILAVAALLGFFMLAAGPAQAQSSFKVNIPFSFAAGDATLPAGEYIVQPPQIGGARAVVLQRIDGKAGAIVLGMPVQTKENRSVARLVFHRYGNRY